jgi:hypothetical protein
MRIIVALSAYTFVISDDVLDGTLAERVITASDASNAKKHTLRIANLATPGIARTEIVDPVIGKHTITRSDVMYDLVLPLQSSPSFSIPGGVGVVIGGTNAGKSVFTHNGLKYNTLAANPGIKVLDVTYMEDRWPEATHVFNPVELVLEMVAAAVQASIRGERLMISVDSFREAMYLQSKSFAAGEGGLSMGFPLQLTALSHIFEDMGVVLVGVVNPMLDSETKREQYDRMVQNFVASVTFTVSLTSETGDRRRADWHARGRNNLERPNGESLVLDLKNYVPSITAKPASEIDKPAPVSEIDATTKESTEEGAPYMTSVRMMDRVRQAAGYGDESLVDFDDNVIETDNI